MVFPRYLRHPVMLLACVAFAATAGAQSPPETSDHTTKAEDGPAFAPGEELRFNVSWGPFRLAGEIHIAADEDPDSRQRVTVEVQTRGAISRFYRYDAKGTSWFDAETGRMLRAEYAEVTNSRSRSRVLEFDYEEGEVHYRDEMEPERNVVLPLPEGEPLDLVTSLVSARKWDLQPGETRDVVVQADRRFYSLRLHAEAIDLVQTPHGEYRALRIVPEPIGPPEGLFKRGGRIQLWIGQDEARLPLRIAVQMKLGTAVATLVEHRIGDVETLAPRAPAERASVTRRAGRFPLKRTN